jgi:biopolymer transport protein ExbB/TolQ
MSALIGLYEKGGPVMIAIVGLSVVLYSRCFNLLFWLRAERRRLGGIRGLDPSRLPELRRRQNEFREAFRAQRMVIAAMIAAAPLLGLLGTVSGMVKTFDSLSNRMGQKSMEGLAHGISEVLVATESGLAVAIPAMLLVFLAHHSVNRILRGLNELQVAVREGTAA